MKTVLNTESHRPQQPRHNRIGSYHHHNKEQANEASDLLLFAKKRLVISLFIHWNLSYICTSCPISEEW